MPPEVLDSYIKTKGAGSHAEIYAVNKLLLDNPNVLFSTLNDASFFTLNDANAA